jgi:acetyl/propionyl-CoA carboxylase alpha subunit
MVSKVLIANRGEIALRIARTATDMRIGCVTVFADDDAGAWRGVFGSAAVSLGARGPAAYLDGARLIAIARETGCDAIHPGYGFLSERADFASACEAEGLTWIGPTPEQLALFGDKARARALAARCEIPLAQGSAHAVSLEEAQAFFAAQNGRAMMIKAIGGGGGRGIRVVRRADEIAEAYRRCGSEAAHAFGAGAVYVERLIERARHIEVQIAGDGVEVAALGERDCTLQRRFQKIVEIAPSPALSTRMRAALTEAALAMARACNFRNLGTFEFLVDETSEELPFVFIEANPRLQVEHTVTEEVTGLDLVRLQIEIAGGRGLAELGLDPAAPPNPRGYAIQWRINLEALETGGSDMLACFELPSGPGVRADTHLVAGARVSPLYDPLIAKVIVRSGSADFADAVRRSQRALGECRIKGPAVSLPLLRALAARPEFESQALHVGFVEENLDALMSEARSYQIAPTQNDETVPAPAPRAASEIIPLGAHVIAAPMAGRIVEIRVEDDARVVAGAPVAVIEAMKMEHLVLADRAGRVRFLRARAGDSLGAGEALLFLLDAEAESSGLAASEVEQDPDRIRPDLQRALDRLAMTRDEARPAAIEKRHALKLRTARENIADLCDPGSFSEYGALAVAAQRARRSEEDLIANTPADGIITGIGRINGALFGAEKARAAVLAYDATVLAGTQGLRGHQKTDRMLEIAERNRLPLVLFAEGGGGRPGDTDTAIVAGLHLTTFARFAGLSGQVPVIGVVAGRCFAGNAALLGCCNVIIATRDSNIGMGGPAMIEGGGLGRFRPEEVGPSDVQAANGVIDVLVADEQEAVAAAKLYLSFFQGRLSQWGCADQRALRGAVPENRSRVYDMRRLLQLLLDSESMLELRPGFGRGILTALGRIEGRPVGVLANNPAHLGGAIDADSADKAARFLQLCNVHGLAVISLVDSPGFMVGPEIEAKAQVRHVCRMFVAAAALRVPFFSLVVRKGYGLGAMAMTAGGFHSPDLIAAWPSGEFGAMGLEGAVRLGYRRELDAASSDEERETLFRKLLAQQYEAGSALNMATALEIDAVIDPADSRAWLSRGLASTATLEPRRLFVDTW